MDKQQTKIEPRVDATIYPPGYFTDNRPLGLGAAGAHLQACDRDAGGRQLSKPKIHIGHTCTRRGVHLEVVERVGSVVLAKARSGGFDGWCVMRITPIGELSAWHRMCENAENARRKFYQLIEDEALDVRR